MQPVTGAQNDFRSYIDTRFGHFNGFDIWLTLTWSAASYRHIVTEWPEIIRFIKLTEGADAWSTFTTLPHPPWRCNTSRLQRPSYQWRIGETLACYVDERSKTWDTGTDNGHVRFQCGPYACVNIVPYKCGQCVERDWIKSAFTGYIRLFQSGENNHPDDAYQDHTNLTVRYQSGTISALRLTSQLRWRELSRWLSVWR